MQKVPKRRPKRKNYGAAEAAEDGADLVRIVVADLRKLLDPLGSRVLARRFVRLEEHAADLDKLAADLTTENGGNGGK